MSNIHVTTFIGAPAERVFDLTRNTSIYKALLKDRKEKFSSGAGSSLIGSGETITFNARHLGKTRIMTARIIEMERPRSFAEEQVKGDLKSFRLENHFKAVENGTILINILHFEGPRDFLGSLFAKFYLKSYLEKFLLKRNEVIKQYAESEKWKMVLN